MTHACIPSISGQGAFEFKAIHGYKVRQGLKTDRLTQILSAVLLVPALVKVATSSAGSYSSSVHITADAQAGYQALSLPPFSHL